MNLPTLITIHSCFKITNLLKNMCCPATTGTIRPNLNKCLLTQVLRIKENNSRIKASEVKIPNIVKYLLYRL